MKKLYIPVLYVLGLLLPTGAALAADQRAAIGVAEFRNNVSAYWWRTGVGRELAGMLTSELSATGKFRVVEREKLHHVLREQNLAASGRVNPATAAKIGRLTGARYLVMGTVSAFERNTKGTGGGISLGPVRFGGKKEDAYLAIDLRVVNTTNGEIAYARTVEARASDTGFNIGLSKGQFRGNLQQEEKTPTGKAIRAVMLEATDYLVCVMVDKGSCAGEYAAKEDRRRSRTKGAVSLD